MELLLSKVDAKTEKDYRLDVKDILGRLAANSGYLLLGNFLSLLLSFISIALMARSLGTTLFGTIALIQSYVLIIDRCLNFQSWQMLVKWGAEALERNDQEDFRRYVKISFLLDIFSAVLSLLVALTLINYIHGVLKLDTQYIGLLKLYSIIIIFNLSGMPTAVLRIFDRYWVYAFYQIILALTRVIGIFIFYLLSPTVENYITVLTVSEVLGSLFLFGAGYLTLRKAGYGNFIMSSVSAITGSMKEIWNFVLTTNVNGTVRMLSRELDIVLVGSFLGAGSVGIYKISKQVASIPGFMTDPLYNAIYPELSRLWAKGKREHLKRIIRKAVKYAFMASVSVWLAFLLVGNKFINIVFGYQYSDAYWPISLYMFGTLLGATTFPFSPAMLSAGLHLKLFWILNYSTAIYFVFLYIFSSKAGLNGAAGAYLFFYVPWTLFAAYYLKKEGLL